MLKLARQQKILSLVDEHGLLSIAEIAQKLNVSEMTIRRDVNELNKKKALTKVHGGVQKIEQQQRRVFSTEEKFPTNITKKKYIGKVINSLINDNSTIFIGAGTTMFYALPEIKAKNLFVITNSLIAFNYLKDETNYRVLLTGGEFDPVTDEFVGPSALKSFENLNIDIAFGATNGIIGNNITTSSTNLGALGVEAYKKSRIKCIVADSTKLGVGDVYTFAHLDELDYLITDDEITKEQADEFGKYIKILSKEVKKN